MKILYTPEERFNGLSDYPFLPNYVEIDDGLKMHYVDEGPRDGQVVLLLHGQPSWSYLYRKMIPVFVGQGYRTIAPDLIGFGKSGKPVEQEDYTYARHLGWVKNFLQQLDLQEVHLFAQDWGGLIGLRIVADLPQLFKTVTIGNTALPTGDHKLPEAFSQWLAFVRSVTYLPCGKILQASTVSELSPEVMAAYDAPFPDSSFQAGAKIFPFLVPITPDNPETRNNRLAWLQLQQFQQPFLTLFSDSDPIMKGGEKVFQKMVPGARHDQHAIIENGGHFLQEDKGEDIARKMINFIASVSG